MLSIVLLGLAVFVMIFGKRLRSLTFSDTVKDWSSVKYFNLNEFDSPDVVGSGSNMKAILIEKLDVLREMYNFPIRVNSGYRTEYHNSSVGGAARSAHLFGYAVDLKADNVTDLKDLYLLAKELGFVRIGQYKSGFSYWLHLDLDPTKAYQGEWYYLDGKKVTKPIV